MRAEVPVRNWVRSASWSEGAAPVRFHTKNWLAMEAMPGSRPVSCRHIRCRLPMVPLRPSRPWRFFAFMDGRVSRLAVVEPERLPDVRCLERPIRWPPPRKGHDHQRGWAGLAQPPRRGRFFAQMLKCSINQLSKKRARQVRYAAPRLRRLDLEPGVLTPCRGPTSRGLVFRPIEEAEKTWRRINGLDKTKLLLEGMAFRTANW